MEKEYTATIARIANEFVEDVAITLINKAKELYENITFRRLVVEYGERQMRENREYMNNVARYMNGETGIEPHHYTALTHANAYKAVIIDILQENYKAEFAEVC